MERALIADDDEHVRAITARWLADAGYAVTTAATFADARRAIESGVPEVVVADIRLGASNGLQLAILARAARPDVRLVMISGWDDPVLRRDAETVGAQYLLKPVEADTLLSAIGDRS